MTCHETRDADGLVTITCTRTVPARTDGTGVTFESVPTSALRAGDVVRTHGMRVLLPEPRDVTADHAAESPVYAARGRVLNPEQVRADRVVPWSWLFHGSESEPHWTIQGNDLAYWTVER